MKFIIKRRIALYCGMLAISLMVLLWVVPYYSGKAVASNGKFYASYVPFCRLNKYAAACGVEQWVKNGGRVIQIGNAAEIYRVCKNMPQSRRAKIADSYELGNSNRVYLTFFAGLLRDSDKDGELELALNSLTTAEVDYLNKNYGCALPSKAIFRSR